MNYPNERPAPFSIYLLPSKIDKLTHKAYEKGFPSRNKLVEHIFDEWFKKEEKK